jgi:hypothetical protein
MSNKTYVRLGNGGMVAEPAISLPAAVPISSIFGTTATFVDVTALATAPSVGETVTVVGTTITVTPATPAAQSPAQIIAAGAAAAILAGCAVTSTGNPALTGTYAIDASSTALINGVATYIAINGKFPAGQSSLPWPDASGALHIFATTAEFQAFASAIADWVTKISLYLNGVATALPTGGETIP